MKKTILITFILFLFQKQFSQNGLCFSPASYSPLLNSLTSSICHADFNNDGFSDLAIGGYGQPDFALNLSTGSGSFASISFTYNCQISFLESGDFNNDGKSDLVLSVPDSNYVKILFGNGTGAFISTSIALVGNYPTALISSDLNNDSKIDLAVCNYNSNSISILLGNGLGGFSSATNFSVGINPSSIVQGDFNADNKIDLAVGTNSVVILKGNANGSFSIINTLSYGFNFLSNVGGYVLKTVDYTGDNKLDIAGIRGDTLYCANGNGNFTFGTLNKYYAGSLLSSLDFADFNNDGKMDIVTSNNQSKDFTILTGNSVGTFTNITTYTLNSTNFPNFLPTIVKVTDVNNDNKKDLVIGYDNSAEITVILNCNSVNVGIAENEIENEIFSLFPNPVNEFINIKLDSEINGFQKIEIMNSLGQIVKDEMLNENNTVNIMALPNGIYLLNLKNDKSGNVSKRFVISH